MRKIALGLGSERCAVMRPCESALRSATQPAAFVSIPRSQSKIALIGMASPVTWVSSASNECEACCCWPVCSVAPNALHFNYQGCFRGGSARSIRLDLPSPQVQTRRKKTARFPLLSAVQGAQTNRAARASRPSSQRCSRIDPAPADRPCLLRGAYAVAGLKTACRVRWRELGSKRHSEALERALQC